MERRVFTRRWINAVILLALMQAQVASPSRQASAGAPASVAAAGQREDDLLHRSSVTLGAKESTGVSAIPTPAPTPIAGLAERVHRTLDRYYLLSPNTRDDSSWNLLHWSIAYGVDAQVRVAGPGGEPVSAVGWLCENRPAGGTQLMHLTSGGLQLPVGAGMQGHPGQFLAMLAQAQVASTFGLQVGDHQLSIADLVKHEQITCHSGMELTFKLIGIAHYSRSTDSWRNSGNEPWSVRRLLEEELRQPISAASTCGGVHRLFALNYAVHRRGLEGLPIDGPWAVAARRTQFYQTRAFQLQNVDGSFSTAWLERRESSGDYNRRLATSGHIVEWLAFSLPSERLSEERFVKGLDYVVGLLEKHQVGARDWGAATHALHALSIYEQRVLGAKPGQRRKSWNGN